MENCYCVTEHNTHSFVNKIGHPEPFLVPCRQNNIPKLGGGASDVFEIRIPGLYIASMLPIVRGASVGVYRLTSSIDYTKDKLVRILDFEEDSYVGLRMGLYRLKNPSRFPVGGAMVEFQFVDFFHAGIYGA